MTDEEGWNIKKGDYLKWTHSNTGRLITVGVATRDVYNTSYKVPTTYVHWHYLETDMFCYISSPNITKIDEDEAVLCYMALIGTDRPSWS